MSTINPTSLKQYRDRHRFSQSQMARFIGVPTRTWVNWEKGDRKPPQVAESLISLLQTLEVIAPHVLQTRLENARKGE